MVRHVEPIDAFRKGVLVRILGLVLLSMMLSVGVSIAKKPKSPDTPSACRPGKAQIVLLNTSKTVAWAKGTKISWKTSHGEAGRMTLSSPVNPKRSLKIGINKPSPESCKARIRLP